MSQFGATARSAAPAAIVAVTLAVAVPAVPVAAAAPLRGPCVQVLVGSVQRFLSGVSASSAANAWAVGFASSAAASRDVTLRWNGSKWSCVPSPSPPDSDLTAVATTSPRNAWAVGYRDAKGGPLSPAAKTLIERWNGRRWVIDDGPNEIERWKGSAWSLSAGVRLPVGTTYWDIGGHSGSDIWLVGETDRDGEFLIEHWNGKAWKRDNKLPLLSA